ncbi:CBS domain-containing protein [Rhodovibrio salinarum]|uniref:CBS domain-containing protein n=1 Tax=Rhodovibrio salinarum TaxID=1087 RepID=A0A934QK88_9PROT|nr:CBS domain-containing protein [Rhodovibrio salinarum]MBK1698448.1 CBS domain-containing protein [Rhodovibrio salinarum]
MKVRQILESKGGELATITPERTIEEAVGELGRRRIGSLVVVDDAGSLIGILSERDVVSAMAEHGMDLTRSHVRDLMTHTVTTCRPDDEVTDVTVKMTDGRFRHVPVMDKGQLVGLISIGDAVKARIQELEHEREALRDYISSG